jgi:molybdopterin-guanine dinucleotide biosynthesis protein A
MKETRLNHALTLAGIILAGGKSSRMGTAKSELPWGDQTLLQHIANILYPTVNPLIIVSGKDQDSKFEIRNSKFEIIFAHDDQPDQGPLIGMLAGLTLAPRDRPIFVTGCDYPFVDLEAVRYLAGELQDFEAIIPKSQGQAHPLVGVYQSSIQPIVEKTIARGERSLHGLLAELRVRWVEDDEWRAIDPNGRMLWNVNTPEEYQAALAAFASSP